MTSYFAPIDPTGLDISSNDRDILRDLFTYLDYVSQHSIKRMTRTNEIPRADSVKIAKLLGDPELVQAAQETGGTQWGDFLDHLAYDLDLVDYDTVGEYRGESSSEPSYIENYITIKDEEARKFWHLPPAEQEKQILESLLEAGGKSAHNELQHDSVLGRLNQMNVYDSHLEKVKFKQVRQFLLKVLESCIPGTWYGTASLIAYLKENHPYFLLPQKLPEKDRWGKPTTRYNGFREGENYWQAREIIPEDAPDAFERVEGRYVERFLENIPLLMRFVDVAYDPAPYVGLLPSRGVLKAFRVNERFPRLMSGLMRGEATPPKVTVQPNFDVIVEADFYPVKIVDQIAALGEQVSSPNSGHGAYVGIFQMNKAAVAAEQVFQPNLDILALLRELTGRDLPPNVQIELEEWAGHADQFTLYEGFALLENVELAAAAEKFIAERITPTLNLVRSPEALYTALETDGRVPLRVQHPGDGFAPVAETAISVFPKESAQIQAPKTARQVKVSRLVTISFKFPDEESFTSTQKMLAELRCPFQSDPKTRVISIQQKEQAKFDEALERLKDTLIIEIE
jgi:hypothetical protein